MAAPSRKPVFTVDQYLGMERAAEERHIYLDGQIFAMANESGPHGDISVNLVGSLFIQLKGTPCRARTKETRVRSGPNPTPGRNMQGLYSYPDIVVICGEPEYADENADIILNPKVIIEVLSPSTEAFDRGAKFDRYHQWNPTLTDYLLVSQDRPHVDHFQRQPAGGWSLNFHDGLNAEVTISSIQCILKLTEIFDRVAFAPA